VIPLEPPGSPRRNWRPEREMKASLISAAVLVAALAAAALAAIDGYPYYRNGAWFPVVLPTVSIEGKRLGLNIVFVPTIRDQRPSLATWHLSPQALV